MNCVRSRAILLSGIVIPARSCVSRLGCRRVLARLMGLSLIDRDWLLHALSRRGALELLVRCCRNCCKIAPAKLTASRRLRLASQAGLVTTGLGHACQRFRLAFRLTQS